MKSMTIAETIFIYIGSPINLTFTVQFCLPLGAKPLSIIDQINESAHICPVAEASRTDSVVFATVAPTVIPFGIAGGWKVSVFFSFFYFHFTPVRWRYTKNLVRVKVAGFDVANTAGKCPTASTQIPGSDCSTRKQMVSNSGIALGNHFHLSLTHQHQPLSLPMRKSSRTEHNVPCIVNTSM